MTETAAPEMSSEQAADFAALNAGASEQPAEVMAAAAPSIDLAGEISGLVTTVVEVLKPALPSLGEIYTEQTIGKASGAIASVCYKHNWLQGGIMGGYGEELTAAFIILPLAIATNNGIKNDIARAKAKAEGGKAVEATAAPAAEAGDDSKALKFG